MSNTLFFVLHAGNGFPIDKPLVLHMTIYIITLYLGCLKIYISFGFGTAAKFWIPPQPLETAIAPATAPGYFATSMGTYRDLATIGTHAEAGRGFAG